MSELNLMKTHKRLYAAAGALELATGGLPKKDKLLVKLRGSFENGCNGGHPRGRNALLTRTSGRG